MSPELLNTLVSLGSATLGAFLTYLLTWHKYSAEVDKLKAETEKIRAEAEILKANAISTQTANLRAISEELITHSESVSIFTKGQSRLTISKTSNGLIIDFHNDQTWSGVALVFTPKLDVREFTHVNIGAIATQSFTFRIEYKIRVDDESKIVAHSPFQSFPATILGSTISIPLKYDGTVDEIAVMFYETGEESYITFESVRLAK
jgi:hypothetical protein